MNEPTPGPTLWDDDGAPETVYLASSPSQTWENGWVVTSLDVGSWRPLSVGDRLVGLDRDSHDEFLVEVAGVEETPSEVFYTLVHLVDLDSTSEPKLDPTRTWLQRP